MINAPGKHPLATPARFLYLNLYAFLLHALGGGAIVIAVLAGMDGPRWWVLALAAVAAIVCLRGGISILATWPDKKRKYNVLMTRNAAGLRPDTFTEFMNAPCGRLLVRLVLADLGCPGSYAQLKSLRPPLTVRLRRECSRNSRRTVVHIMKEENTD